MNSENENVNSGQNAVALDQNDPMACHYRPHAENNPPFPPGPSDPVFPNPPNSVPIENLSENFESASGGNTLNVTPTVNLSKLANAGSGSANWPPEPNPGSTLNSSASAGPDKDNTVFAVNFVQKIFLKYPNDRTLYHQFVDLVNKLKATPNDQHPSIILNLLSLLESDQELLNEFILFAPIELLPEKYKKTRKQLSSQQLNILDHNNNNNIITITTSQNHGSSLPNPTTNASHVTPEMSQAVTNEEGKGMKVSDEVNLFAEIKIHFVHNLKRMDIFKELIACVRGCVNNYNPIKARFVSNLRENGLDYALAVLREEYYKLEMDLYDTLVRLIESHMHWVNRILEHMRISLLDGTLAEYAPSEYGPNSYYVPSNFYVPTSNLPPQHQNQHHHHHQQTQHHQNQQSTQSAQNAQYYGYHTSTTAHHHHHHVQTTQQLPPPMTSKHHVIANHSVDQNVIKQQNNSYEDPMQYKRANLQPAANRSNVIKKSRANANNASANNGGAANSIPNSINSYKHSTYQNLNVVSTQNQMSQTNHNRIYENLKRCHEVLFNKDACKYRVFMKMLYLFNSNCIDMFDLIRSFMVILLDGCYEVVPYNLDKNCTRTAYRFQLTNFMLNPYTTRPINQINKYKGTISDGDANTKEAISMQVESILQTCYSLFDYDDANVLYKLFLECKDYLLHSYVEESNNLVKEQNFMPKDKDSIKRIDNIETFHDYKHDVFCQYNNIKRVLNNKSYDNHPFSNFAKIDNATLSSQLDGINLADGSYHNDMRHLTSARAYLDQSVRVTHSYYVPREDMPKSMVTCRLAEHEKILNTSLFSNKVYDSEKGSATTRGNTVGINSGNLQTNNLNGVTINNNNNNTIDLNNIINFRSSEPVVTGTYTVPISAMTSMELLEDDLFEYYRARDLLDFGKSFLGDFIKTDASINFEEFTVAHSAFPVFINLLTVVYGGSATDEILAFIMNNYKSEKETVKEMLGVILNRLKERERKWTCNQLEHLNNWRESLQNYNLRSLDYKDNKEGKRHKSKFKFNTTMNELKVKKVSVISVEKKWQGRLYKKVLRPVTNLMFMPVAYYMINENMFKNFGTENGYQYMSSLNRLLFEHYSGYFVISGTMCAYSKLYVLLMNLLAEVYEYFYYKHQVAEFQRLINLTAEYMGFQNESNNNYFATVGDSNSCKYGDFEDMIRMNFGVQLYKAYEIMDIVHEASKQLNILLNEPETINDLSDVAQTKVNDEQLMLNWVENNIKFFKRGENAAEVSSTSNANVNNKENENSDCVSLIVYKMEFSDKYGGGDAEKRAYLDELMQIDNFEESIKYGIDRIMIDGIKVPICVQCRYLSVEEAIEENNGTNKIKAGRYNHNTNNNAKSNRGNGGKNGKDMMTGNSKNGNFVIRFIEELAEKNIKDLSKKGQFELWLSTRNNKLVKKLSSLSSRLPASDETVAEQQPIKSFLYEDVDLAAEETVDGMNKRSVDSSASSHSNFNVSSQNNVLPGKKRTRTKSILCGKLYNFTLYSRDLIEKRKTRQVEYKTNLENLLNIKYKNK